MKSVIRGMPAGTSV